MDQQSEQRAGEFIDNLLDEQPSFDKFFDKNDRSRDLDSSRSSGIHYDYKNDDSYEHNMN